MMGQLGRSWGGFYSAPWGQFQTTITHHDTSPTHTEESKASAAAQFAVEKANAMAWLISLQLQYVAAKTSGDKQRAMELESEIRSTAKKYGISPKPFLEAPTKKSTMPMKRSAPRSASESLSAAIASGAVAAGVVSPAEAAALVPAAETPAAATMSLWPWLLGGGALVLAVVLFLVLRKKPETGGRK